MNMMDVERQLTDGQYTKLTDGESVEVEFDGDEEVFLTLRPPCSVRGHIWIAHEMYYPNEELVRVCERCGVTGTVDTTDNEALDVITEVEE